ncbi:MAG: DUF3343 domain-containing protein [Spirochaetia bacterium]|nr:DUF3343 domain-containing protein [Spirochaetia bacterium]MCF7940980.1 DUF3343 domain-containing protein [Spirochaetia bacterium]
MSESTQEFRYLITFLSTFYTMEAEEVFLSRDEASFLLIPTPREISSECGFSIQCSAVPTGIQGIEAIYHIRKNERKGVRYEQID